MKQTIIFFLVGLCLMLSGCSKKSGIAEATSMENEQIQETSVEIANKSLVEEIEDEALSIEDKYIPLSRVESEELANMGGIIDERDIDFDRNGVMDRALIIGGETEPSLIFEVNGLAFQYEQDRELGLGLWILQVESGDIDNDGYWEIIFNYDLGGSGGTGCQYIGIMKYFNEQLFLMPVPKDNGSVEQGPGLVVKVKKGEEYSIMEAYCQLLNRSIAFNGEQMISNAGFLPNNYKQDVVDVFKPGTLYGENTGGYYKFYISRDRERSYLWCVEGLQGYYARAEYLGDVAFKFDWDRKGNVEVIDYLYFEDEMDRDMFLGSSLNLDCQYEDGTYYVLRQNETVTWYGNDNKSYKAFVTDKKYPVYYDNATRNYYQEKDITIADIPQFDEESLIDIEDGILRDKHEFCIGQDFIPFYIKNAKRGHIVYNEKGIYYINYRIQVTPAVYYQINIINNEDGSPADDTVSWDQLMTYATGEYILQDGKFVLQNFSLGERIANEQDDM